MKKIDRHIDGFLAAVQFITILPAGRTPHYAPQRMIAYFPLTGILIGTMVSIFDCLARRGWSDPVAALLDVIVLAVLTGGLHLDGLGDTADGLLGHHRRDRALEIMKDSRIGAMALLAMTAVMAVKWAGIAGLGAHRGLWLVLVPALARGGMLFAVRCLPYGRLQGTGRALFDQPLPSSAFWALALVALCCLAMGTRGLVLLAGFGLLTAALVSYFRRRMGCVTGDMLGAMTEVTEAGLFLIMAAGAGA